MQAERFLVSQKIAEDYCDCVSCEGCHTKLVPLPIRCFCAAEGRVEIMIFVLMERTAG